jgi:pyruvate formate lyase activating enzyme
MKIHGFNKTTLLDYPGHLASTIFLGSCNFRCPFCHNASLVLYPDSQPVISEIQVLDALKKRQNLLEGVCITGGEPTLEKDLPSFIEKVKNLGLKVKLDTNGSNPTLIKYLLDQKLIDYIAMDIKNSIDKYPLSIGIPTFDIKKICDSVNIIMNATINYEFRTTVVKEHHNQEDFKLIGQWLLGADAYYLQSYIDSGDTISSGLSPCSKIELLNFKNISAPYFNLVEIRGVD